MKSKVLKGGNKMIDINILHNELVDKYNSVNLEYLVSFFKELEDYILDSVFSSDFEVYIPIYIFVSL